MPRRFLDSGTDRIFDAAADMLQEAFRYARRVLDEHVRLTVERPSIPLDGKIPGEEVVPYLEACRLSVERFLNDTFGGWSPIRWLWMLRRLPISFFEGDLSTTANYDLALAEILTGRFVANDQIRASPASELRFDTSTSSIRRAFRFAACVVYLSDIHAALRWAGKDCQFIFDRSLIPTHMPDEVLRSAVRSYDERVTRSAGDFVRSGTVLDSSGYQGVTILSCGRVHPPKWIEVPLSLSDPQNKAEVYCSFGVRPIVLDDAIQLNTSVHQAGSNWITRELVLLLLFLHLAYLFVLNHNYGTLGIFQRGYLLYTRSSFEELMARAWPEVAKSFGTNFGSELPRTSTEFIDLVKSMNGSTWPILYGSPLRIDGDTAVLDVFGAMQRLDAAMEFPRVTGAAANLRSRHFEEAVQDLIDESPWKTGDEVRRLRGRTLRINGTNITDIDAIGSRYDELLLVSCKAEIYSGRYDTGDRATVRNVASRAEDAVSSWDQKCMVLADTPKGDNYDFTPFKMFHRYVCTPGVVYVPPGSATSAIKNGLPAVCSAQELKEWLSRAGSPPSSGRA